MIPQLLINSIILWTNSFHISTMCPQPENRTHNLGTYSDDLKRLRKCIRKPACYTPPHVGISSHMGEYILQFESSPLLRMRGRVRGSSNACPTSGKTYFAVQILRKFFEPATNSGFPSYHE